MGRRQRPTCTYSRHTLAELAPFSYLSIEEDEANGGSPAASFTAVRRRAIPAARLVTDPVTGLTCDLAFAYYREPGTDSCYHLKRQYVDAPGDHNGVHYDTPSALLCPACAAALLPDAKLPSHCIARGLDLGYLRAVLTDWTHDLTRLERLAIAPVRLHVLVIKFSEGVGTIHSPPHLKGVVGVCYYPLNWSRKRGAPKSTGHAGSAHVVVTCFSAR